MSSSIAGNTETPRRVALMIETDGPGGAEMMVFRLGEELRRRGHYVLPVGPPAGTGWMGSMFREAGFSPETFRLDRPVDPPLVRRLARLFREHRIDFVHSHEFTMAVYGSAAARLRSLPHIITMHGGFTATKALRRRIALRWAMRGSGATVAVSNATRVEFARDLGVRESAFDVIHNEVPARTGNPSGVRREFGCKDGEVVILAVGNLDRNKNHRMLLEALVRLEQEAIRVPWRLIIAAGRGGAERDFLVDFAKSRGIADRVHLALGRDDVADLQALADLFVMPSLWEGLPMALLEAMVAGKAIIASRTAGIPEAIGDGREGLLVEPGNLDALVDSLRALLTDSARRRTLGDAARLRAHREFTIEVMTDRYLATYRRVEASGHAQRANPSHKTA